MSEFFRKINFGGFISDQIVVHLMIDVSSLCFNF